MYVWYVCMYVCIHACVNVHVCTCMYMYAWDLIIPTTRLLFQVELLQSVLLVLVALLELQSWIGHVCVCVCYVALS